MPRGFLVKRYTNQLPTDNQSANDCPLPLQLTTRPMIYRYSDEDRSESSSSDAEALASNTPSPLPITHSTTHSLVSLALSPPLLSYSKKYSNCELPQEAPLALTKNSYPTKRKSTVSTPPADDESPSALDLRCPGFIFHFPDRMPSSAPTAYQRTPKRHKVIRKLNFDEHKSSPVSGTFIRDSDSEDDYNHQTCVRRSGDIDPSLNVVVITDEARAEIEKIENKIGDYICALCKEKYDDAFGLAQHRCTRIVHVEYRCPECDKVFNCPANLASHRRWHKPRPNGGNGNSGGTKKNKVSVMGTAVIQSDINTTSNCSIESTSSASDETNSQSQESIDGKYECECCHKKFRRNAYLKRHLLSLHNIDIENNNKSSDGKHNNEFAFIAKQLAKRKHSANDRQLSTENDYQYRCLLCNLVFNSDLALQMHNKSVHIIASQQSLNCKYCPNVLPNEADLTKHINKYHTKNDNQNNESILKSVQTLIKQEVI
ncbi:insulinoma-associated protein 1a-like [Oppia nitens]|uniref:insulinoma-associated protein 1a-like n=1 Tax=Oppia nitens TaxID=1686743 RepID=UPI0023DA2A6F|nr:insulinoma-associated protein 1a-like [Oppia nitens]